MKSSLRTREELMGLIELMELIDLMSVFLEDLDLPLENQKVTANKETRILWSAPRTWLIISSKKNIINNIKNKCDHENFAVTDISHSRAVIQIKGLQAKEVLKKGCPININEIQVNNCAGTVFNGITVVVDFVNNNPNMAGTITPHHMMLTKKDVFFKDFLNPHHFCMPVVKEESDLLALRKYACSGNKKFFLGTDSAPHHIDFKILNTNFIDHLN